MSAGFPVGRIAFEEDGEHAKAVAELDVGERVADHCAGFGGDGGDSRNRLMEEAGQGLAAVALVVVVGAEEEAVQVRAGLPELALQVLVDGQDVRSRVETKGDAALVGNDDDAEAGAVEASDGLRYAGEQLEIVPGGDVATFRQLAVEDAIAVEEDSQQDTGMIAARGVSHAAMIATG